MTRRPAPVQLPPALAPIFNNLNIQPQPSGANPRRPGNTAGQQPGPGIFGTMPQQEQPPAPVQAAPPAQPAANPFGAVSTPGMIAAPAASQPGQLVPQVQQQRRSPNYD